MNRFESALRIAPHDDGIRTGLIHVADTMWLCRQWLLDHYPDSHAASDAIAMAAMVMSEADKVEGGRS